MEEPLFEIEVIEFFVLMVERVRVVGEGSEYFRSKDLDLGDGFVLVVFLME